MNQRDWDKALLDLRTARLPKLRFTDKLRTRRHSTDGSTIEWETPPWLFELLSREFRFTLDACATRKNALCRRFITAREDGLRVDWRSRARRGVVWLNPPYNNIHAWIAKAAAEAARGATIVMLIPARTGTSWWWSYVTRGEVRFIRGSLRYWVNGREGSWAPFHSAVVVLGPRVRRSIKWWDVDAELDVPRRFNNAA